MSYDKLKNSALHRCIYCGRFMESYAHQEICKEQSCWVHSPEKTLSGPCGHTVIDLEMIEKIMYEKEPPYVKRR